MSSALSSAEAKLSYYGWIVVAVIFLAESLAFGLVYSFGVFLKPLASQFHWSRAATAGAVSAYAITHTLMAPVTGRLTDRFGPKVTAAMGGFCIGLTMLLMSHVTAIWQLYLLYALVFALGLASVYAPLMAVASQWFTQKRGMAVGVTAAGVGAGTLVFSPLAAWLISSYGWRTAYIIVGAICWVLFVPVVRFVKQAPKRVTEAAAENDSKADFTSTEALREKAFWMISFTWLFGMIVIGAIMIHIVPLLTDVGLSLTTAGIIAGVIGGASMAGRIGIGILSDRIGRKRGLLIALAIQLIGLIFFLFCQGLPMFILFSIIFGLGFGGFAGIIPAFPADLFGLKATATILGLVTVLAGVGTALGSFAGGYIFDATGSYYYMIWMSIAASIAAMTFGALVRPPLRRRGQ